MASSTLITLIVVIVLLVIVVAAVMYYQRRRSEELRQQFGPEYDRTLKQFGGQHQAERVLEERQKRVEALDIRPLAATDRTLFADQWRSIQARFVDDPAGAADQADLIIGEVMQKRGYPVADFDQRAADISVEHPDVVSNYRAAHAVAVRARSGEATTDELRSALINFRALFQELLETTPEMQRKVQK